MKGRGVPSGYVEGLSEARTKLADFFSILIETQMQLSVKLGFTTADHAAFDLADRAGKLLTGLHKKMSTT